VLIADGEKDKLQSFFVPGSGTGDLDKLYEVIRDRKAGQTTFGVRKPMLLLDEKRQDRGWTMRFRGQFENDVREVEFEVTVTTPDLGLELDGWKYLSCRYLGERRRTKVQPVRMGGGELNAAR
jgi:hypothetical protein